MRDSVALAGKGVEDRGPLRGPLRVELQMPERDLPSRKLVGGEDLRRDGAIPLQIALGFGLKRRIIPHRSLGHALAVFLQQDWLEGVIVGDEFIQVSMLPGEQEFSAGELVL